MAVENKKWIKVTDRVESEPEMRMRLPEAISQLELWKNENVLVHC